MKLELVCVIGIDVTIIDPNSNEHTIMHTQTIYNSECEFNSSRDFKLTVLMMFTVILYEIHTHIYL